MATNKNKINSNAVETVTAKAKPTTLKVADILPCLPLHEVRAVREIENSHGKRTAKQNEIALTLYRNGWSSQFPAIAVKLPAHFDAISAQELRIADFNDQITEANEKIINIFAYSEVDASDTRLALDREAHITRADIARQGITTFNNVQPLYSLIGGTTRFSCIPYINEICKELNITPITEIPVLLLDVTEFDEATQQGILLEIAARSNLDVTKGQTVMSTNDILSTASRMFDSGFIEQKARDILGNSPAQKSYAFLRASNDRRFKSLRMLEGVLNGIYTKYPSYKYSDFNESIGRTKAAKGKSQGENWTLEEMKAYLETGKTLVQRNADANKEAPAKALDSDAIGRLKSPLIQFIAELVIAGKFAELQILAGIDAKAQDALYSTFEKVENGNADIDENA